MTRYTVVWTRSALAELAELWSAAAARQAVTDAADAIDRELAADPSTKGVELSEGLRALFVPPLKVLFQVNDDDRIVEVPVIRLI